MKNSKLKTRITRARLLLPLCILHFSILHCPAQLRTGIDEYANTYRTATTLTFGTDDATDYVITRTAAGPLAILGKQGAVNGLVLYSETGEQLRGLYIGGTNSGNFPAGDVLLQVMGNVWFRDTNFSAALVLTNYLSLAGTGYVNSLTISNGLELLNTAGNLSELDWLGVNNSNYVGLAAASVFSSNSVWILPTNGIGPRTVGIMIGTNLNGITNKLELATIGSGLAYDGVTLTSTGGSADGYPHPGLTNLSILATNGLVGRTASNTFLARTITGTANEITVSNGDGVSGNPTISLGDTDLTAVAGLSANGLVTRTGTGTMAVRTLTGTANQITVADGDGVAANPTLSLPSTVTALTLNANNLNTGLAVVTNNVGYVVTTLAPANATNYTINTTNAEVTIIGTNYIGISTISGGASGYRYFCGLTITNSVSTNLNLWFNTAWQGYGTVPTEITNGKVARITFEVEGTSIRYGAVVQQ